MILRQRSCWKLPGLSAMSCKVGYTERSFYRATRSRLNTALTYVVVKDETGGRTGNRLVAFHPKFIGEIQPSGGSEPRLTPSVVENNPSDRGTLGIGSRLTWLLTMFATGVVSNDMGLI